MEKDKVELGERLGSFMVKFRWPVVVLSVLMSLALGSGGRFLSMSSDYRYFFGPDNPQRVAFDKLQNVYSNDDSGIIVIEPKNGEVFNSRTLSLIKKFTDGAWKLPYATRVDSITNFQYTEAFEDDLVVRDLVTQEIIDSNDFKEIEKVKKYALSEQLLVNSVLARDSKVAAINVRITLPMKSPFEIPEFAKALQDYKKEIVKEYPDHNIYLSGIAMMNNAFNEAGMNDMMTLTPIMYGIIIILMIVLLKSVSATISTFGVIFMSVLAAMGITGFIGIPLTPPSSIAPTVIVTLAIADSIHILKAILGFMREGIGKSEAIKKGMSLNLLPVFLTSFTTIIGFLSLNFSDTPPFNDLGNITAIGVAFAFIFSVTFLPAIFSILPVKVKIKKKEESAFFKGYSNWIVKNYKILIGATLLITTFLAAMIPNLKINDEYVKYFDHRMEFRRDADFVIDRLTGLYYVNFDLHSGESQGISDPTFLKNVDKFVVWLRNQEEVVNVNTISDTFKRLNKNMHGDDSNYYKLPDSRQLAAQYLLLYEMSLPYGLDLNNQVDVDKSATKVRVTLGNVDTTQMLEFVDRSENWLGKNVPKHMQTIGSSPAVMFSHITGRNIKSMFWGTLIAFALITLVMMLSLRDLKYGLISLLPNIIPATMAFGLWYFIEGEVGFAIAIVGSVTLGIVVDDTVHFLTKYVRARKEGLSSREAVDYSFKNVGSALFVTTVILSIGFATLMYSPFKMNFILGALSALTIIIALIVDFTFLPAVLIFLDKKSYQTKNTTESSLKMKSATLSLLFILSTALFTLPFQAKASTPEEKGLEIAKKIDGALDGFGNQVSSVEMTLLNKHGQKSGRKMRIKTLEVKDDGDKSLTIFDTPRDVKGTAFLSFTHAIGADDQWLYLPALRRVKKISSNNKSGPFMGSEFAYEDISSQEVEKYTYKYIRAEKIDGKDGHVIERYPVDKNSGYTKQIVWADEKAWRVHKIDFYDRKGSLLKTMTSKGFKKYPNGQWRADEFFMENHQSGKKTSLVWSDIKFNQDISSRDFDKNALKRIK